MDIIRSGRPQIGRLEIVEKGRRRHFSDEAKLAIVAESYSGPQQVSATARRHEITRFQLNSWRKAVREGRLGGGSLAGFVPVVPHYDVAAEHPVPVPVADPEPSLSGAGRMEIVIASGRRVVVDRDVDVDALLRIVRGLEGLE